MEIKVSIGLVAVPRLPAQPAAEPAKAQEKPHAPLPEPERSPTTGLPSESSFQTMAERGPARTERVLKPYGVPMLPADPDP